MSTPDFGDIAQTPNHRPQTTVNSAESPASQPGRRGAGIPSYGVGAAAQTTNCQTLAPVVSAAGV